MDNRKGKGENGEDKELDLTLKLGQSVQHNQSEEDDVQESTSAASNDMVLRFPQLVLDCAFLAPDCATYVRYLVLFELLINLR